MKPSEHLTKANIFIEKGQRQNFMEGDTIALPKFQKSWQDVNNMVPPYDQETWPWWTTYKDNMKKWWFSISFFFFGGGGEQGCAHKMEGQ